jgi:hypothetical protein
MPDYVIKGTLAPYPSIYKPIATPGATRTFGISQPDLLIKTALDAGFADLKKYPFLLDFCFAWLPQDPVTYKKNGEISVKSAKDWFLNTPINVFMNYRPVDFGAAPCISISINSSNEEYNTLGDTNYDTSEQMLPKTLVAILSSNLNTYTSTTGVFVFNNPTNTIITNNMIVFDLDKNMSVPILSVEATNSITLDVGLTYPLQNIAILPADQFYDVALESARFKESYSLNMFVNTKEEHIIYLSCLAQFCLLRYRQAYLDERGFEQTSISSGAVNREAVDDKEIFFSRSMTISGYVQQYWPKEVTLKIQGIQFGIVIASNLDGPVGETPAQLAQAPWTTEKTDFKSSDSQYVLLDTPFEE